MIKKLLVVLAASLTLIACTADPETNKTTPANTAPAPLPASTATPVSSPATPQPTATATPTATMSPVKGEAKAGEK
jgi:uncharacterized lipoprotein YajG